MFKAFNIEMNEANIVLTNMCHLYEVGEEQAAAGDAMPFDAPPGRTCGGARFVASRACDWRF